MVKENKRYGFLKACLLMGCTGLWSVTSQALVDYSEPTDLAPPDPVRAAPAPRPQVQSKAPAPSAQTAGARKGFRYLEMGVNYDAMELGIDDTQGKVHRMGAHMNLRTRYSFFTELSYFQSSTDSRDLSKSGSMQKGNPKIKVGFNWLQLGNPEDNARVDILAGATLGTRDSDLATSRSDKIFGVQTSKRIYDVVFAFGAEAIMTGDPKNERELKIGNILKLGAGFGWVVSQDIRFTMEATYAKIQDHSGKKGYYLSSPVSYSSLSPKMHLGLLPGSLLELELGAHLRTKRAKNPKENEKLLDARLFDFPGIYGNSIYAGLNISV